jgi:hypothetical protein
MQCCPVPPVTPITPPSDLRLIYHDWETTGDIFGVNIASFSKNGTRSTLYAGGNNDPVVLVYDTDQWIQLSESIPVDMLYSITVDGIGTVFATGVIYDGDFTTPVVATYDALSGVWTVRSGGYIGTMQYGVLYASATGPNGRVYAAGRESSYPIVISYDSETQLWENVVGGCINLRSGVILALTIDTSGILYVGGIYSNSQIFVFKYVDEWIDIQNGGDMFSSAFRLNTLSIGENRYLYAGGTYGSFPYYPYVMRMDLTTQLWETIYDNSVDERSGTIYSIVTQEGYVYACGNTTNSNIPYVIQYDGSGWTTLTNTFPEQVRVLSIGYNGSLLAGGYGYIQSYQPYTLTWTIPENGSTLTFNVYSSSVRIRTGLPVNYVNISAYLSQTPVSFYVTSVSTITGIESEPSNSVTYP